MNAKEQALEYVKKHDLRTFTPEEFFGKMIIEGMVISRTSNSKVIARARREGKTIIVTETTITTKHDIINGKIVDRVEETTIEIFRADL